MWPTVNLLLPTPVYAHPICLSLFVRVILLCFVCLLPTRKKREVVQFEAACRNVRRVLFMQKPSIFRTIVKIYTLCYSFRLLAHKWWIFSCVWEPGEKGGLSLVCLANSPCLLGTTCAVKKADQPLGHNEVLEFLHYAFHCVLNMTGILHVESFEFALSSAWYDIPWIQTWFTLLSI